MADQTKQKAVYAFLHEYAVSGATFTTKDLAVKMGWTGTTAATYRSKHFDAYLDRVAQGVYRVLPEFRRVNWEQFQDIVTQVRRPFASYNRATYRAVVVYDFLMPLTREDKLRKALDELFYRDTLERRIKEVGLAILAKAIPREIGDSDDRYMDRVIAFIDDRVGGFSISHVSGRFRTGAILRRSKAAEQLERDEPYLIDETTAVVRFIIPCQSTRTVHGLDFDLREPAQESAAHHFSRGGRQRRPRRNCRGVHRDTVARAAEDQARMGVVHEVRQIRTIFFELFVEALVPTIRGEKLIWMLETTPMGQRLYELGLVERKLRGGAKDADAVEEEDDDGAGGG